MRKSFTWLLGLLVLLTSFATQSFAQEVQETVELYAEDASYCYDEANDYTVTIAVRDFIKLTSFELNLVFDDDVFVFEGESAVHSSLSSGLTVSETGGVISLDWSDAETTIGDNVKTDVLELHFSVLGYPGTVASPLESDMNWGTTNFWYTTTSGSDDVNTDASYDGALAVSIVPGAIETTVTTESCAGGDVTLSVTAPDADMYLFNEDPNPDNWVWSDSPDYQVSAGDVVTVRVKDADGCMSLMETVTIPETRKPVSFTVETQDPACFGGKGSVVIDASGGVGPYTYYINTTDSPTGATEKTNFQWSQATGTYYVAVQDANGCANLADAGYWQEITITDTNTPITGSVAITHVDCNGAANGSLTITVLEGGSAATDVYEVSLDGGLTWGGEDVYTFDDLDAGDYVVKVRNSNDCVVTIDDAVTITEPDAIDFDIAVVDVQCGSANNGEIAVTNITGGTAPYTLEVEEGGNVTPQTGVTAAGYTFTGLKPTYYSLTITDANGCSKEYVNPNGTGNVIAVQSPDDIQFDVEITGPVCNNEDASVAITNVTGGTGSYVYSFDGGTTWVDTMTIDSWPAPYASTDISVANAADNSCAVTQTIDDTDVLNPAPLMAGVTDVFAPTCIDGNDGNIYLNISGGIKPYSYSINGSAWREANYDNLAIIRVGVGKHEIMVKDSLGCEYSTTITQDVTLEESIIAADSVDIIDCYDDPSGIIDVNFVSWAGGIDGVTGLPNRSVEYYVESEDGTFTSFVPNNIAADPEDITNFAAGTYVVWVVDQYTCESNTDTVVVTQNDELIIEDIVANGASCFSTFEGTITVHASGGNTNALEYAFVNNKGALGNIEDSKWKPFQTYDSETDLSAVSFQVDAGTYWVAVRDNGCDEVYSDTIVVEGYEELLVDEADIVFEDPKCYADSNGVITVPMDAVTGGAGSYLFTLLDGTDTPIEGYVDLATGEFTGLKAGTYKVLVEDAEDCPAYTTEEFVLENPDELTFATTFMHISCEDANDGVITVTAAGGTGEYSYAINNPNSWVAFAEGASTKTYIATEPGTFRVWVKDENGCTVGPDTITIMEPTKLGAELDIDSVSCYGDNDGALAVTGTGGWAGVTSYEFKLNDGLWTSSTTFSGLTAGEDTLYIRDVANYALTPDYDTLQALDCIDSVIFTVEQPDPIVYDVVVNEVKCKDGADGSMTIEVLSGGTPFVDATGDNDGFLVRVTGAGYDESYYTGEDNSLTLDNLEHSIYTVYITDANGCTLAPTASDSISPYQTIESFEVAEPDEYLDLAATFVQDATCYGAEDGQFTVAATGGTGSYMYAASLSIEPNGHVLVPVAPDEDSDAWQDTTLFNVGAGTWVVWVMDSNGCIKGGETDEFGVPVNEWRVKIEQPDSIEWAFHTIDGVTHYAPPKCYGSWDGAIHIVNDGSTSIVGGSGIYNAHVWGTSADGSIVDTTYMGIQPDGGLYWLRGVPASDTVGFEVTVIDSLNGCVSAIDTVVIDQPEELTVDLVTGEDAFTCFGAVEGLIEANAEGGTGAYEYQLWKNGEIHTPWTDVASAFLVKVGNTFVVEVRDANGCTASDTIYIETPLEVEFGVKDLTCADSEKASARIMATGTPGRMFRAIYTEIENDINVDADTTEWFETSIDLMNTFVFDSENTDDVHYRIIVEDEVGCTSGDTIVTFDASDIDAVELVIDEGEVTECYQEITISAFGGVKPYVVMVNDSVLTEPYAYSLPRGEHTITVMGAHECTATEIINVTGEYVTRDTTIETYISHQTEFIDEEAAVDTMFAVGTYEIVYTHGDCERTLNVTVVEVPRPLTIAEIQGEADETPWMGEIVTLTATITGVSPNEGFFMQDADAAWSGIWVPYLETTDLEVGDGVEVIGEVDENSAVTMIRPSSVTEVDAEVEITGVVLDGPADVEAEMYESVLVTVNGARAMAANETTGQWTIYYESNETAVVNDFLYAYTPEEGTFYNVTGIVNGRLDAFTLEPRMESDIVDLGLTPNEPELKLVEFKVYPNPFSDRIYIDNNDKLTRVVISNVAGQRVIDVEYPSNEIRTANLVSGVYIVSMFTEDGIAKSERIVKR